MKRLFTRPLCRAGYVLFVVLAACRLAAEPPVRAGFAEDSRIPSGWQAASPRDEIRPQFSFDPQGGPNGEGSLIIVADQREGLSGWWQKSFPIVGGQHYRFHAQRKVQRREGTAPQRPCADCLAG